MTATAFLFPGQGSQYPGIGKDIFEAYAIVRETYQEASEVLGYDIAKLSFDDPDNAIGLTRYTQPVLLTHSIACLRLFTLQCADAASPNIAAGHSLGEYCALVCAGALTFELALRLVKKRGELMGGLGEGEMQALMIDAESAKHLAEAHYCAIAAYNLPEQTVVGGLPEDLDALVASMARLHPGKKSTRLKTEGAFHTYYMVAAAQQFRSALAEADFAVPNITVLSNFTGGKHDADAHSIRSRLFQQLFNPVLWQQNLLAAKASGTSLIIEFGGGLGKGETAAGKRPALESIVNRTFRGDDNAPAYCAVINRKTLEETVAALK